MQSIPAIQPDGKTIVLPAQPLAASLVSEQLGEGLRALAERVEIKPLEKVVPLPTGPLVRQDYAAPLSAHLYGAGEAVKLEADRAQVELIRRIGGVESLWTSFVRERCGQSHPHAAKMVVEQFEENLDWARRTVAEFKEKGKFGHWNNFPDFMGRVEQFHLSTAAFLDLYGNEGQRKKAIASLLWDMEHNSRFDAKEPNIDGTLGDIRRCYAIAGRLVPKQFERFGDLVQAMGTVINTKYPQHLETFRNAIIRTVLNNNISFSGGFLDAVRGDPKGVLGTTLGESSGPYDAEERTLAMGLFHQRMLSVIDGLRQSQERHSAGAKTAVA